MPSSVVPSISALTVSEGTSGLSAQFGGYVQNKSKAKVAITATGAYSSTIKTYKTTVAGKSYSGNSFTSSVLTGSGSVTISTTVTDSRGRTASKSTTISVQAYTAPKITKFTSARTDAGVSVTMNFSITSLGEKNTKSYSVDYKLKTSDTWTVLTSGSVYSYNATQTFANTFSTESSYDLRLVVKDFFGTASQATAYAEIATAFTLMDFHSSGKGMAIGKVCETEDELEVDLDANFYRNIQMGGWKKTNDEKNLYIQSTDDAQYVHDCKLYGGNGASPTSIGCWDSARSHGIWRYLSSTQNLVFDANVKVTRANGGDEFITSDPVTHGSRSGKVYLSNGLLIQWGAESVTPVANTPTAKAVTFSTSYTSLPMVIACPITTAMGASVTGGTVANITATGFDAYVTRTNTTNTTIGWIAIGYKA